jgi:hypothetical protein
MSSYLNVTSRLLLLVVIAGCATKPPVQEPVAVAAATPVTVMAPAPVASAPAAPVATSAASTAGKPTIDAATLATARSLGYTPRVNKGTVVFCRTEANLGTRFQSTTCIPQDQVVSAVHRAQGNKDSLEDAQKLSLAQQRRE